ncbi:Pex19 protein [Candida orthopsilosis Co 90-125]|uniref:Pex19 protein n=1 Tax=Candida orthopsilosis (strain 90-125) TaxID=1136231 RepID=H8X5H2_CANO9|nr:Pex19 protein [Candida orthopsilosis Co 90-125]CCG23428.1 Pex19 protein [Candida orthopsilosis Co 90-125]
MSEEIKNQGDLASTTVQNASNSAGATTGTADAAAAAAAAAATATATTTSTKDHTKNIDEGSAVKTQDRSDEKTKASSGGDDVDDLDDLLDDFADDVLSKPPGSTLDNQSQTGSITKKEGKGASSSTDPVNEDFQNSVAELIKDMKIEDPETQKQFETLVQQFETNHRSEAESGAQQTANFDFVMKETMERLRKSGEDIDSKIKNDSSGTNPEDILTQLLAGMNESGLGGGDMDMSKLLIDMLEQLSSKEVLYEPIKDLNNKFPQYLEDNKDKLDQEQYANYTKQYDITNDILKVFESDSYNDSNKAQRDQINAMLESLQELGQPPTELVGDTGDFLPGFGGAGKDGLDGLDFDGKDLPPDLEKNLQEGCQQQ